MKKLLLLSAALVAFNCAVIAAPLDTKGIPADAQGVVHLDLELCAKTTLGAEIRKFAEKALLENKSAKSADYELFKKQTGLDPATDISSVTFALFKSTGFPKNGATIAIARGKFSPEKLIAAAQSNNFKVSKLGALTLLEGTMPQNPVPATADDEDTETPAQNTPPQKLFTSIVDQNTLILAETSDAIAKAAAAFSDSSKNYTQPAVLSTFARQTGAPMVIAYVGGDLTAAGGSQLPIGKPENVLIALFEKGPDLQTRIFSEYATPEAARKTQAGVQMLIGFLQMGAANSDSPDAAENMQNLQHIVDSLKINANGKTLDISASFPVADLVQLLKKQAEKN